MAKDPATSATPTSSFKTPKLVLLAVSNIAVNKAHQYWYETLILGILAGAYIGIGGMVAITVGGGVPGFTSTLQLPGLQRLLFGATFPVGLMMVIMTGAELSTGNMFIMPGVLLKKTTMKDLVRNWTLSYVGNYIGAVFVAYFMCFLAGFYKDDPHRSFVVNMLESKIIHLGWGEAVLRGIGCNWLVCLAVFLAVASEDVNSKIWSVFWPIMTFVTIGFEHGPANMFFLSLSFMVRSANLSLYPTIGDTHYGYFIGKNLIPVTIGNIIGAAVLTALANYISYGVSHDDVRLKTKEDKAKKREKNKKSNDIVVYYDSNTKNEDDDDNGDVEKRSVPLRQVTATETTTTMVLPQPITSVPVANQPKLQSYQFPPWK